MSERLARLVSYPLVLAGLAGLVLRVHYATQQDAPRADDRWALALAVAPVVILSFVWVARCLRSASRALLMWWAMRLEARREARRTILLNLPVPVLAKVEETAARVDGLQQQMDFITASLTDKARAAGQEVPDLEATCPHLRLVLGGQDSASA